MLRSIKKSAILTTGMITLALLVSCQTTEELRKEKEMENKVSRSEEQITEYHRVMADQSRKLLEIEAQSGKNLGAIEEVRHQLNQNEQKTNERLGILENRITEMNAIIEEQKNTLKEQKQYIEEVLNSLTKLQDNLTRPGKSHKKIHKERIKEKSKMKDAESSDGSEQSREDKKKVYR